MSRTLLRFSVLFAGAMIVASGTPSSHDATAATPVNAPVADTGSVKGSFVSLERLKTKGDTSQRDVVVYLVERDKKTYPAPAAAVKVTQERLIFTPHVLAVLKGSKLELQNVDQVVHNVFSTDACCSVDLDMPAGKTEAITLEKPGVASVVCRLHPDMSMYIVVLENPYFTQIEVVKAGEGDSATYTANYEIANVPPGEYDLTFWNKKVTPKTFPVVIKAGEATTLDVSVGAP